MIFFAQGSGTVCLVLTVFSYRLANSSNVILPVLLITLQVNKLSSKARSVKAEPGIFVFAIGAKSDSIINNMRVLTNL